MDIDLVFDLFIITTMKTAEYWMIVFKHRRILIMNTLAVTIIAIIISLLLTQKYTATATILPPTADQTTMLGMFAAGPTSGIANLSRLTSGLPGLFSPSDLYAALIESSRITGIIIDRYDLKKEFTVKTKTDAARALEDITNIEVTPEGIISVSVTYKKKQLAVDIANSYIEELDTFNKEVAMTAGKKYRIFVEQRLEESRDSLTQAEESLRNFQENNLTVALEEEMVSVIKTVAELKSRIIMLETKRGALAASAQSDNPYLREIDRELAQLKSQLSKIEFGEQKTTKKEFGAGFSVPLAELPEVYLEYARLYREVKIQEAIYQLLTEQYEQARIMESKDTPTVQFLDRASPPEKRSWPRRTLIVIFAFVLSIVFNVLLAFIIEYVHDIKEDPKSHKTIIKVVNDLSEDIKLLKKTIAGRFKRT